MINLIVNSSFKPSFCSYNAIQKQGVTKPNLKLLAPLSMDTVCFTGKKNRPISTGTISETEYQSVLKEPLISEPRPTFEKDLKLERLVSYNDAKVRISSLSRYLKEDMVGFVVPKYDVNGEQKGGYQWFEKAAEYLIRGSKENVKESNFKPVAKELYGLLALHDNYWKSPEFIDYLSTLKQSPAIKATIAAVKELNAPKTSNVSKELSFRGSLFLTTKGFFSPLKVIDKLSKTNCAYTGEKFTTYNDHTSQPDAPKNQPSLDHIMPKSWGGPCEDYNYILASRDSNTLRGNIELIKFLRGAVDEIH